MKLSLLKGLSEKDANKVKESFLGAETFTERLIKVLQEKSEPILTASQYEDNPSWAYKQADEIGYRRALNEVIKLLQEK